MKLKSKKPVPLEVVSSPQQEDIRELLDTGNVRFSMIVDKAYNIQSLCEDFMVRGVNNRNLMLNDCAGISYVTEAGEVRKPAISRHAMGQLCNKVGVPHDYMRRCIGSGRIELAQDNLNSWLEDFNKDLFIREYNGSIRGVLSNKYSVCDSPKILEAVSDAVNLSKLKLKGHSSMKKDFM